MTQPEPYAVVFSPAARRGIARLAIDAATAGCARPEDTCAIWPCETTAPDDFGEDRDEKDHLVYVGVR